ncbi:MAG TPA: hypothetical protein VFY90_08455 [Tepidiformaceae bacterium]|nr:hypothetical protein [Tepidiformaceae bacterium]
MSEATSRHGPFLREYQARNFYELIAAVATMRGETFTVLYPRQAGKNELSAALIAALLRGNADAGGTIVQCAPTLTPQGLISFERTRRWLGTTDHVMTPPAVMEDSVPTIGVGRARAIFLSASPAAHVAGHTATIALIADEAQEIDADWFNRQFRPMAASTGAPTVLFGTPWDSRTLLDEAVARNREHEARAMGQLRLHYEVGWPEVAEVNEAYGQYVRHERDRLGPRHPLFLSQYGLRTIEGGGRLFSAEALAAMEGRHARLQEPIADERYVAGLDVAGDGENADASVLTIARVVAGGACEVVQHLAWRSKRITELEAAVTAAANLWRFERLVIDATGMGLAIAPHLEQELGRTEVEAFVFSAGSKSELGYQMIGAAGRGALRLYAHDGSAEAEACRAELRACSSSHRPNRKIAWGNDRGSDDYVASLALCLRAVESAGAPRVAVGRTR